MEHLTTRFSEKDFERFFRQYHRLALVISFRITQDMSASEDIVQDVFYYIWNNSEKINPNESIKSYLLKSVKNRSLNYVRDKKDFSEINNDHDGLATEEYDFSREEKISFILNEIDKLPFKCKQIFKMVVLEGKKYQDVANILNVSVNTVKTQMGIAYKQLRNVGKKFFLLLFSPFSKVHV
ncbi:RNA polymerase sigma-70 factor [Puteibacter caeruleilacunae]|nr:RNA polymerase sigma-70 factor [Puteibacter caeruleilacunae]